MKYNADKSMWYAAYLLDKLNRMLLQQNYFW